MSSPFSVRRAAIAVFALMAMLGTALLVPSTSSAAPVRAAAPTPQAAEAPVLAGGPIDVTADGRTESPRNLRAGCRMPRCFGSIAVNTRTGFWAKTSNYGKKKRAKKRALKLCRTANRADRYCKTMGWVRGNGCLAAAKRVTHGQIRQVASAAKRNKKRAYKRAIRKLDGKRKYKKKITATCNG